MYVALTGGMMIKNLFIYDYICINFMKDKTCFEGHCLSSIANFMQQLTLHLLGHVY